MIWLAGGIAILAFTIGYMVGHQVGFESAKRAAKQVTEVLLVECLDHVSEPDRDGAIKAMRKALEMEMS